MNSAAEQRRSEDPLGIDANPFGFVAGAPLAGDQLQQALGDVMRHLGLETPLVIVAGNPGTGKTLLMNMLAQACSGMDLAVCQIERGDLASAAPGEHADVILVDEADCVPDSALHALLPPSSKAATTVVLLCLPSSVPRFSHCSPVVVALHGLSDADAEDFLLERANSIGRPALFTPAALELIVQGARGSPRLLRSLASMAFFAAAYEGERQIGFDQIAHAMGSPMTPNSGEEGKSPPADNPRRDPAPAAVRHEWRHATLLHTLRQWLGDVHMQVRRVIGGLPTKWPARRAGMVGIAVAIGLVSVMSALLANSDGTGEPKNLGYEAVAPAPLVPRPDFVTLRAPAPAPPDEPFAAAADAPVEAPESLARPVDAATLPVSEPAVKAENANVTPEGRAETPVEKADSAVPLPAQAPVPVPTRVPVRERLTAQAVTARNAAQRARNAEEAARQAENAARLAGEAARQADELAHKADLAARQAEQAARQAGRPNNIRIPWLIP